MTDDASCTSGPPQDFVLAHERTIAAPPERVWDVMTNRLEQWWCPVPWRAEINRIDWRAGGAFDTTMHGPEGQVMAGSGLFLDVVPGQRFVFTDALSSAFEPQPPFMVGVFEIAPDGNGGTRYRASARHWTAEAMEQHRAMGFDDGWAAAAAQLAALCEA